MKKLLFILLIALTAKAQTVVNSYNVSLINREGLQLFYDFANTNCYAGTGTTINDLSGNGRNGTLTNGPVFSTNNAGQFTFDGTNDYAEAPYSVAGLTNATISVWVKHGATVANKTIASFWGNSTRIFGFIIASGTKVDFAYNINNVPALITPATTFTVGNWYLYTFTYDSAASQVKAYINGAYQTGASVSGAWTNPGGTVKAYLGAVSPSADYNSCSIGMFWVTNKTQTAAEILANYNSTKARYGY